MILEVNVGLQQVNDYFQDQVEESQRGKLEVFTVLQNGILNYLNQFNEQQGIKVEVVHEIGQRVLNILEEPLRNENSLFVNSLKEVQFTEEIFGILQQLLYYCPQLYENICQSEYKMYRLFKVTIYQFCKSIEDRNVNNTYYVSLCLLTILSNNKAFNEMLNKKKDFNMNLKNFPIVDGTLADLLISCCAQSIINNKYSHTLCHPFNLMSILKNISPFVRNISRISCQKLNQLSILFTDMDFLTQTSFTPMCIVKLIEMYNYILSFNFMDNLALVFEIYNRQEIFSRIPKINFHEKTLRAYYKELKDRYESMKNNTAVTDAIPIPKQQHQQQDQLQKQGQQLQELSQQLQIQKKESIQQQQLKEQQQQQLQQQLQQQQEEFPSSSSLSQKKRPKRVTKKKVGLENGDVEKKGLQTSSPRGSKRQLSKKDLDAKEEKSSKSVSKQDLEQEEEEETKEESKSENNHKEQSSDRQQKYNVNRGIEIEIHQKNPEDLFVERWKDFNWRSIYANMPLSNISNVIKNTNEFINNNMKKNRYAITFETFAFEKNFLNGLKALMTQNTQFLQDHFQNYEEILNLSYQCCWMQILTKAKYFPHFDTTKVLFFRIDIAPLQVNMNDQSINVELQSNNTLMDMK